jgi:hypothetical protein
MNRLSASLIAVGVWLVGVPGGANAQSMDVVGTRAAGMAGAFVGVADDASASYWNPGGLAAGAYFSLVLDGGAEQAVPDQSSRGRKQSSFLMSVAMPALAVTYYRLHQSRATPFQLLVPANGGSPSPVVSSELPVRVDSLATHHLGITLVQSVFQNVAVGTTLKVVRGIAATDQSGFVTAETALDSADVRGRASNEFDLDVGAMATFGTLKAGITVRNVREPEFRLPEETRTVHLQRQARAGLSYALSPTWLVAADVDLLETDDVFGERRDVAVGVEGRLTRRLSVRSGVHFNTAESAVDIDETDRALAFGGSFALRAAMFVDGAAIVGGDRGGRGWRIGARFLY